MRLPATILEYSRAASSSFPDLKNARANANFAGRYFGSLSSEARSSFCAASRSLSLSARSAK